MKLEAKFSKLIKNIAAREGEMHAYLSEVVVAQNMSGVVLMTLFQLLIEKGVLTREEIDDRFDKNQKLALDAEGNCVIELKSLLDAGGKKDGDEEG